MFVSVVIPTHRRPTELTRVLAALVDQTVPRDRFEVVLVEDETRPTVNPIIERFQNRLSIRFALSGGGKGNTRNVGVHTSQGDLVLFLDDDVVPEPDLVAAHIDAHTVRYPGPEAAVLGLVVQHPEIPRNAFRDWLENWGPQFAYPRLAPYAEISPAFFYTCNLSMKPSLLEGEPFDEDLTFYEDFELGYRLRRRRGMRLYYVPEARGLHLAADRFESYVRKRHDAGRQRPHYLRAAPEARMTIERLPGGVAALRAMLAVLGPPCRVLGTRLAELPPAYARWFGGIFGLALRASFVQGYGKGLRDLAAREEGSGISVP